MKILLIFLFFISSCSTTTLDTESGISRTQFLLLPEFMAMNMAEDAYRQEIKNAQEAAYHWLYSHEHEWLETVLPNATKTRHVDRVDWCQRDNELVDVIRELLLSSSNKLSRTELDKALGGHGWLTSKLKKMPKTKELLRKSNLFISNT
mgnify:CR=1 FL=1